MRNFLAIFTCAENSKNHHAWMKLSKEEQHNRMEKGMTMKVAWQEKHKNDIIYDGGPLDDKTKLVDTLGIHNHPSKMGYFLIVRAHSHEEAAQMFLDHPHFAIFPGDGIEVIECAQRAIN